jgi:TetR/AcrR family transcriptional regulator, ethionamide resistance regulator
MAALATSTEQRSSSKRRREEARAVVLRSALELAENAQFSDLTVDEIARASGISRSAFYLHYRDKNDLLLDAVEEVAGNLYVMADRWWHGEGAAPAELVRNAMTGVVSVWAEHASLLRVVIEVSGYGEEVREKWFGIVQRFIDATAEHLASEQRKGLVPDRLDPTASAEALVWGVERCCYIYLSRADRSPEELVEQLTTVWVAALYPGVVPASELGPNGPKDALWGVPAPEFER